MLGVIQYLLSSSLSRGLVIANGFAQVYLLNVTIGKEAFGALSTAMVVLLIITTVAQGGCIQLLSRKLPKYLSHRRLAPAVALSASSLLRTAFWLVLVFILMCVSSPLIIHGEAAATVFRFVLILFPGYLVLGLAQVLQTVMNSFGNVALSTFLVEALIPTLRTLLLLPLFFGLNSDLVLFASYCTSASLVLLVMGGWVIRRSGIRISLNRKSLSGVMGAHRRYIAGAANRNYTINNVFNSIVAGTDMLLLSSLVGPAAAADYSIAKRLAEVGAMALNYMSRRYLVVISKAVNARDQVNKETVYLARISMAWAAVVALGFVAVGRPFLSIFGNYQSAYFILVTMAGARIIDSAYGAPAYYLIAKGRSRDILHVSLFAGIVGVALYTITIRQMGSMGAAISYLLLLILSNQLWFAKAQQSGLDDSLRRPLVTLVALALFGCAWGWWEAGGTIQLYR